MPDPRDPTPVRVEKRGGKFVVVSADGSKLPDTEPFDDSAKAAGVAARVNASWKGAKSERKSKGAPEITREALTEALGELEERAWPLTGGQELHLRFDPRLHQRDRLGRFVETLRKLQFAEHGSSVELPHGVKVRTRLGAFEVRSGSGTVRLRSLHAAAAQALTHVDDAEVARGTDANAIHPRRIDELRAARLGAMQGPYSGVTHIDGLIKAERKAHEARNPPVPFSNRHGRTAASKAYWKSRIHVDSKTGMQNLNRALAPLRAR